MSTSNTATIEPAPTPSAEPAAPLTDTNVASAEAAPTKPDAGKPDAGKPDAGKAPA